MTGLICSPGSRFCSTLTASAGPAGPSRREASCAPALQRLQPARPALLALEPARQQPDEIAERAAVVRQRRQRDPLVGAMVAAARGPELDRRDAGLEERDGVG